MTKTLKSVEEPRVWEGGKYPIAFINVAFEDGTKAYYKAKPDSMEKRHEELSKLLGTPSEFTLEDDGRGGQKITDYPGKPQPQQGGGGGRAYVDNSPSIEAQGAVKNAVRFVGQFKDTLMPDGSFQRLTPEEAFELVAHFAPRLHELTQSLKNGGPARPQSAVARPAGVQENSSHPERSAPVGAADDLRTHTASEWVETAAKAAGARTWADVNAKASGGSRTQAHGEGASDSSPSDLSSEAPVSAGHGAGASESSGAGEVRTKAGPLSVGDPLSSPGPTHELEELWALASARDLTRARVVAILKKAGQPIASADDVDARQLRSLLGVTR